MACDFLSRVPRGLLGAQAIPFDFKYPLCDSNAQPTDSKSGTLSIELRGQILRLAGIMRRIADAVRRCS